MKLRILTLRNGELFWQCYPLLLVASLFMFAAGCGGNLKGYGVGAWPVYAVPESPTFTDEEKAVLIAFSVEHKEIFAKIKGQSDAYRAIILTHNKKAIDINKAQLKALGHDDAMIERMYPKAEVQDVEALRRVQER